MERFRVNAVPDGDSCTLVISGDADIAGAPDIVELGTASLTDAAIRTLVVDLLAVTFMDSTALGALIAVRNTADQLGKQLVLDAIPPRVQRLIDLVGLSDFLGVDAATGATLL